MKQEEKGAIAEDLINLEIPVGLEDFLQLAGEEPEFEPAAPSLAHAMWIHGTSVQAEYPGRLSQIRRRGDYAYFEGKLGTTNWFHFAIPTPVIVDGYSLKLNMIILTFACSPDAWVTNVHIYDGHQKMKTFDGLSLTGMHWFESFHVGNEHPRRAVGISVGVKFGTNEDQRQYVGFISGGADFIR